MALPGRSNVTLVIGADDKASGVLKRIGGGITGFAKVAVAAVAGATAAFVGLGAISIKSAISVQSAFTGVAKTTDGLVDQFGELTVVGAEIRQGFRDLAKEVPIAVEELLGIGELAGQLGIPKEALIDFTATVAALAETTNLTTEEAASDLARLGNIFQIEAADMAGNTERIGSTIVELGNNFATTERDILSFGTRIAGVGKIVGLTQADILGIGTAMASVGVEAEAGGTAVQKVLIELQKAVIGTSEEFVDNTEEIAKVKNSLIDLRSSLEVAKLKQDEFTESTKASTRAAAEARIDKLTRQILDQKAALSILSGAMEEGGGKLEVFAKAIGITTEEFVEVFERDAAEAFQLFVKSLGDAGDDAISILKELGLEDQRLIRSFLSLAGAGDLITRAMDTSSEAFETNEALGKEAQLRYGTMESQLAILRNTLKDVGVTIGDSLLPFLKKAVDFVKPFIEQFGEVLPALLEEKLLPAIENVIKFFAEDLPAVVADIGAFLEPLGAGIGDLVASVLESKDEWKAAWEDLIDFAETAFVPAIQESLDNIGEALTNLSELWEENDSVIIDIIGKFAQSVLATFGVLALSLSQAFKGMTQIMQGDWEGFWQSTKDTLESQMNLILAIADTNLEEFLATWEGVFKNIGIIVTEVWDATVSGFEEAAKAIGEFIGNIIDAINNFQIALLNLVLPEWLQIDSPSPFEIGLKGISEAMGSLGRTTRTAFQPITEAASGLARQGPRGGGDVTQMQDHFNLTVNSMARSFDVIGTFESMRATRGGAT